MISPTGGQVGELLPAVRHFVKDWRGNLLAVDASAASFPTHTDTDGAELVSLWSLLRGGTPSPTAIGANGLSFSDWLHVEYGRRETVIVPLGAIVKVAGSHGQPYRFAGVSTGTTTSGTMYLLTTLAGESYHILSVPTSSVADLWVVR